MTAVILIVKTSNLKSSLLDLQIHIIFICYYIICAELLPILVHFLDNIPHLQTPIRELVVIMPYVMTGNLFQSVNP